MTRSLTNQDISWFLDQMERGQLNLDPPYQRRSVWSPSDKRYFIDTILNNYPAPPIFLHKTLDVEGRATYHVVDGKQRLQTIIEFRENRIRIPNDFSDVNLQKKRWDDLEGATKQRFWNYVLIVEMLPNVNDAEIRNIFDRINRNSRKLVPQEMRHAKYDGWFIKFVEGEVEKTEWKTFGVVTPARIKRMADVQFLSELCAVILKGKLLGFDHDSLDEIYAEYEDILEDATFVEDDFYAEVERIKGTIAELVSLETEVTNYLKVQSHFYTLWAYLHLEKDRYQRNGIFAPRYKKYMEVVSATVAAPDVEEVRLANEDQDFSYESVLDYANNFRGASTDLVPRSKRHEGLVDAMYGHKAVAHEDR